MIDNFRNETFLQFIKTQRPNIFLKIIWIGAFFSLVLVFFLTFKNNLTYFLILLGFVLVGLAIQALFFYTILYRAYNLGREAYVELISFNPEIIHNAEVYIRGFDFYSKAESFDLNLKNVIYDFEKADLLISSTRMFILGKGSYSYAPPSEITFSGKSTNRASAKLIEWKEQHGRLLITVRDDTYASSFTIEFKDHAAQIKAWLARNRR